MSHTIVPADTAPAPISRDRLERLLSADRLSTYLAQCGGSFEQAIELYCWNARVTAAFWEPLGHLEVALRNTLSDRLTARHRRLRRAGSWLDDPASELTARARTDIARARARVQRKGKHSDDGRTISELSFGFWRFLLTKRLTRLWPDLAGAFPHAPDRRRETLEVPLVRLHDFRNRLAHHERVWNRDLDARHRDLLLVAGSIDPGLPGWIDATGPLRRLLAVAPSDGRHAATGVWRAGVV